MLKREKRGRLEGGGRRREGRETTDPSKISSEYPVREIKSLLA
jgi:hypothetical protein